MSSAHSNASATPNPITVDHEARLRELQENAYQSVLVCFLQEEFDLVSESIFIWRKNWKVCQSVS